MSFKSNLTIYFHTYTHEKRRPHCRLSANRGLSKPMKPNKQQETYADMTTGLHRNTGRV